MCAGLGELGEDRVVRNPGYVDIIVPASAFFSNEKTEVRFETSGFLCAPRNPAPLLSERAKKKHKKHFESLKQAGRNSSKMMGYWPEMISVKLKQDGEERGEARAKWGDRQNEVGKWTLNQMKAKTGNWEEENQVNEGKRRIMWEGLGYEQRLFRLWIPFQSNSRSTELTCSSSIFFFFFQSLSYVRCAEVRWKIIIATLKKKLLEVLVLVLWEAFSSVEKNGSVWGWKPVAALRCVFPFVLAVLEPNKVPLPVQWQNWIHWSSAATDVWGEFF